MKSRVFVNQPRKELPIATPQLFMRFSDLVRDMAKLNKAELLFCLGEMRKQMQALEADPAKVLKEIEMSEMLSL